MSVKLNCTLGLGRLGKENISVERGAAMSVSINEPRNSPGILPIPNEIAPSSRNGKTTKYALNTYIYITNSQSKHDILI